MKESGRSCGSECGSEFCNKVLQCSLWVLYFKIKPITPMTTETSLT